MGAAARLCVAIVSFSIATGCRTDVPAVVKSVNPQGWNEAVTLIVDNRDTVSERLISIVLRHAAVCDSLPLYVEVSTPDTKYYGERFVVYPHGRNSSIPVTESFAYRSGSVLSECGYYLFTVWPQTPVRGVEAVGIEIVGE